MGTYLGAGTAGGKKRKPRESWITWFKPNWGRGALAGHREGREGLGLWCWGAGLGGLAEMH